MVDSKYWVWHQFLFGYGTARSHDIMQKYPNQEELFLKMKSEELPEELFLANEKENFLKAMQQAERIVALTYKKKCSIVTPDSEEYPNLLRHTYGKPAALYVKGSLECLNSGLNFTMVGARRNSEYGERAVEYFAKGLVYAGANIISGLAFGIDSLAHKYTVQYGGNTVGVLACGLDYDYPKGNAEIKTMVSNNGAVITEYPMGVKPRPSMFMPRNRIMSGMSNGVIIVEAGDESGSLVTARLAFDSDREVFVIPNEVFSGTFAGSHNLIKKGIGKLVTSPRDILMEYPEFISSQEEKPQKPAKIEREYLPKGMEESVYKTYEAVDRRHKTTNEIANDAGIAIAETLGAVTTLELLGLIRSLPGGYFTLNSD